MWAPADALSQEAAMKAILTLLFIFILTSPPAIAQNSPAADSSAVDRGKAGRQDSMFVDRDGNGIDDRQERSEGKGLRRKDRFVDSDGDGICDGRAGGLGLRFRGGTGAAKGKQGHSGGGGRK
jgi:hypothetical protein